MAERLSMLLESLVIHGATDVRLHYKQKDLCTLLGTQRTTLIATLDRLADQGILTYDSNELCVIDTQVLTDENLD